MPLNKETKSESECKSVTGVELTSYIVAVYHLSHNVTGTFFLGHE